MILSRLRSLELTEASHSERPKQQKCDDVALCHKKRKISENGGSTSPNALFTKGICYGRGAYKNVTQQKFRVYGFLRRDRQMKSGLNWKAGRTNPLHRSQRCPALTDASHSERRKQQKCDDVALCYKQRKISEN